MNVQAIYDGSDGEATKALYTRLSAIGPAGEIALNLFRASKSSTRAKVYRGGIRGHGSFKGMAYDRKTWAMGNLCTVLTSHAQQFEIAWGWKVDPLQDFHRWVLYIDLPLSHGQVSFHAQHRGDGPDYVGEWDGIKGLSSDRIVRWCEQVLGGSINQQASTSPTDAPRWLWCRHCMVFWANRRTCPLHTQQMLEVKDVPATLPALQPSVTAEWNEAAT